jgi:hypothetical protein
VRVWRLLPEEPIDGSVAENLAALAGGVTLDRKTGIPHTLSRAERLALLPSLEQALPADSAWRDALTRAHPWNGDTIWLARENVTLRDYISNVIEKGDESSIAEALTLDPGNPLLPFALAEVEEKAAAVPGESGEDANEDPNESAEHLKRAAFLCEFGLKYLPKQAEIAVRAAKMLDEEQDEDVIDRIYERAVEVEPRANDAEGWRAYIAALAEVGTADEWLAARNKFLALPSAAPQDFMVASAQAQDAGDTEMARSILESAVKRFPNDTEARNALAKIER